MKARLDAILQRDQAEYLDRLLPQTDRLLTEMEAYAAKHNVPIADREVARFIEITARTSGAKRALEIGMAIGYTTLHLARAAGAIVEHRVHQALESDRNLPAIARRRSAGTASSNLIRRSSSAMSQAPARAAGAECEGW